MLNSGEKNFRFFLSVTKIHTPSLCKLNDEFVNQYHYSSDESCFKTKYDVKQPPQDWLGNDFVECIKSEMLSKLPHRTFRICGVLVINLGDVRNSGGIWS
jgi:hypothetical protein